MVAGPEPPYDADLLEDLGRRLRALDVLLAGLSEDMASAGARSASERAERARDQLRVAVDVVGRLRSPDDGSVGR